MYSPAKPAKVWVVFDCSVCSRGSSLNDRAYQGPKLTTLLNVVLLCIIYSCVISGDVQAMYNQVKVPVVGDRDMMRFLWNGRAYRNLRHTCSVTVGARPVQFMHFVELRNMMPCIAVMMQSPRSVTDYTWKI